MDRQWTSTRELHEIADERATQSERYDDISLLLAHEQLDGFVYQSFRASASRAASAPAPEPAAPAPVSNTLNRRSDTAPLALTAVPAGAPTVLAEPPAAPTPATVMDVPHAASPAAAGEDRGFSALFQRLAGAGAVAAAERPSLDLSLPSRPVVPRSGPARVELIALPKQHAFARLRDAAPVRLAVAG